MVNKFIIRLAIEYGSRVGKSVYNAYSRVVNSSGGATSGAQGAFNQTIGKYLSKPMTRDEAIQILSVKDDQQLSHIEVMDVSKRQP